VEIARLARMQLLHCTIWGLRKCMGANFLLSEMFTRTQLAKVALNTQPSCNTLLIVIVTRRYNARPAPELSSSYMWKALTRLTRAFGRHLHAGSTELKNGNLTVSLRGGALKIKILIAF
jgi:hypothetical protein